ncbi:MAG: hypothetical protein IIW51_07720 [Peptococcaceae bacterium]|nr:hypothetical protein [Peptococcaceae bacterium]
MKNKFAAVMLILLVMLFAAGCGGNETALESVDVQMMQESYMVGDVAVEVTYPVVSSQEEAGKLIDTLNQTFAGNAEQFINLVAERYAETAAADEVFSYQADVLFNEKGMISIVEGQRCGQDYFQYAATYSLADGKKMTLGELMDMNEEKAEETVSKQFGGIIQSYPDAFHADAAEYVTEHIDEVQYYRYSEGLDVFFPVGSIAPAEQGVQEMVMQ